MTDPIWDRSVEPESAAGKVDYGGQTNPFQSSATRCASIGLSFNLPRRFNRT
jgi:hypothetical protein